MTIVPSNNIDAATFLPQPAFHLFYHRGKADDLPKCSGFLQSQSRFSLALIKAMLRGGARD